MTKAKTASELEALIRRQTGIDQDEMMISVRPMRGETPNWQCTVKYTDPSGGMGPDVSFLHEVAALQRAYHLDEKS